MFSCISLRAAPGQICPKAATEHFSLLPIFIMKPGFWLSTISSLLRPFPSLAAPDMPSIQACRKIANVVPDRVSYPHSMPYESEMSKYWSVAVRDVRPACIAHPTTPEEVSNIVKTLNGFPDVAFATKSGGHDPNPGHGSVEDGVLIALREITGTEYDENRKVAHVRPGGEWNDVIRVLDKEDVVVLGGRLGEIFRFPPPPDRTSRLTMILGPFRDCWHWRISCTGGDFVSQRPVRPSSRCKSQCHGL